MHVGVLLVCIYVHCMCALCPWRLEEGIEFPEIKVNDGCEPPYGSWEMNPGTFARTVSVLSH